MARISRLAIAVVVGVLALVPYRAPQAAAGAGPSIDQFLMPGYPTEVEFVSISDDGSVVTFVRGTQPNREGWGVDLAGVHLWDHGRRALTIAECG